MLSLWGREAPRPARGLFLATVSAVALAGCADRLDHFGRPPTMSPVAAPKEAIDPSLESNPAQLAKESAFETASLQPATRHAPRGSAIPRPGEGARRASLWSSGPGSLFDDRRARVVGDILTIEIDIEDEASIQNDTSRSRNSTDTASVNAAFGLTTYLANLLPSFPNFSSPNLDATSSSSSDGSGSITRADDLELRLAAQVTEVLPNGNLVITGSQEIRVNSELRDLQIAGVVRPEDITRSNTITLDKIANARVSYGGRGVITDAQDPSFFQQVLGLLTPF